MRCLLTSGITLAPALPAHGQAKIIAPQSLGPANGDVLLWDYLAVPVK